MATATTVSPCASIVIEWENMHFAEADRSRCMLQELSRQIDSYCESSVTSTAAWFDILVLFDPEAATEQPLRDFIAEHLTACNEYWQLRILPSPGLNYYEQKNRGGREALGEILLFLDCDVIPDAGWLPAIMDHFNDPELHVVTGTCYLHVDSIYSKAFALSWFFPLRSNEPTTTPHPTVACNSMAMRKSVLMAHPFESIPGSSRGACRLWARELNTRGVTIYRTTRAQVNHPAPNGWKHFLVRALAQGRDNLLFARTSQRGSLLRSTIRSVKHQLRAIRKIIWNRKQVALPLWQVPGAIAISSTYYGLYFAGDIMTRMFPRYMTSHFLD